MIELFFLMWLADIVATLGPATFGGVIVALFVTGFYVINVSDNWNASREEKHSKIKKALVTCASIVGTMVALCVFTPSRHTILTFAALNAGTTFAEYSGLDETATKALHLLNSKLDELSEEKESKTTE